MKKLIFTLLFAPSICLANSDSVLINEVAWMGTAISANDEWLELYNISDEEIDLTGWKLVAVDGSPAINLSGKISPNSYYLLERTDDDTVLEQTANLIYTGSLSNTGEDLQLFDQEGNLIDELLTASGWPGGDNTEKKTLQKNQAGDWLSSEAAGGSPKTENIFSGEGNEDEDLILENNTSTPENDNNDSPAIPVTDNQGKKYDIIISEVLPDPNEAKQEFIELYNASKKIISLDGWQITNSFKQTYTLDPITMIPGCRIVLKRLLTNLALNNTKEKLSLYNRDHSLIDVFEYNNALTDLSRQKECDPEKISDCRYCWNEPTEKLPNNCPLIILPQAVINGPTSAEVGEIINLNASDSFDPKNRPLTFAWDFGDGRKGEGLSPRQIYASAGSYQIKLWAIAENHVSSTAVLKIKITGETSLKIDTASALEPTPAIFATSTFDRYQTSVLPDIFISEFLPDPEGADTDNEFIELFNAENRSLDLSGYYLDDAEGGSKPYTLPEGSIIRPGQYLAFFRSQTKIALNNSDDQVRFLSPSQQILDQAEYEKTKSGQSFVLDENYDWQPSSTPSPNEINILNQTDVKEAVDDTEKNSTSTDQKVLGEKIVASEPLEQKNNSRLFLAIGAFVIVAGLVAANRLYQNKKNA